MKALIRILMILLLLALVAGTLYYLYLRSRPKEVIHKTSTCTVMDIIKKTVASGTVTARKEVAVKPQISGIIEELPLEAGDLVTKGQVLARIRLVPNLVRINDAEARLKKAQVNLDYAQKTYNRVERRYRQSIRSGGISRKKESPHLIKLNQAEAELETARISLAGAQKDYDRQKTLFDRQFITTEAFDETKLKLDKAREDLRKALANFEMMKAQTVDTTEAELQEAENELAQARQELSSARANLQLLHEGIAASSPEKTNTLVRATIDGMILDIPVKEGESAVEISTQSEGTTIAVIADMNDMIFKGSVDESEIHKIRPGMDLILTIGAIPGARFKAAIEHISPKGVEENGAVRFHIRAKVVPDENYFIRAGYSAGADIVLDRKDQVPAVEEGSLIFKGDKVFAEVETGPNRFERREIKVGLSDGIHIQVVEGLKPGDKLKVQQ